MPPATGVGGPLPPLFSPSLDHCARTLALRTAVSSPANFWLPLSASFDGMGQSKGNLLALSITTGKCVFPSWRSSSCSERPYPVPRESARISLVASLLVGGPIPPTASTREHVLACFSSERGPAEPLARQCHRPGQSWVAVRAVYQCEYPGHQNAGNGQLRRLLQRSVPHKVYVVQHRGTLPRPLFIFFQQLLPDRAQLRVFRLLSAQLHGSLKDAHHPIHHRLHRPRCLTGLRHSVLSLELLLPDLVTSGIAVLVLRLREGFVALSLEGLSRVWLSHWVDFLLFAAAAARSSR